MKLSCFSAFLILFSAFLLPPSSFAQTTGQWVFSKKSATGYDKVNVTGGNSQVWALDGSGAMVILPQSTFAAAAHNQAWSTITATPTTLAGYGIADGITAAAVAAGYQPLDSDLTSIAALTTTAHGLSLLTGADAAASRTTLGLGTLATQSATITDYLLTATASSTYQPLDADLTSISALTTDAFGRGLLPLTTAAAVRTYIGESVNVQVFTANGTWTKPANAKSVHIRLVGEGGGGGSGYYNINADSGNPVGGGGGGGAGGGVIDVWSHPDALGATEAVVVGDGQLGGAGQTATATGGNAPTDSAVDTTFSIFVAKKGLPGAGGTTTTATGGAGTTLSYIYGQTASMTGTTGGTGNATNGAQSGAGNTVTANICPGAGGGGAGYGATQDGATRANAGMPTTQLTYAGGMLGGLGGINGLPSSGLVDQCRGVDGVTSKNGVGTGGGGGGRGSTVRTDGTGAASDSGLYNDGGNGGFPGGGGGGGGYGRYFDTGGGGNPGERLRSGAGGNGAGGIAIITTYCAP